MRYSILVLAMVSTATIARAQGQQASTPTTTQTGVQGVQGGVQTGVQGGARGGRGAGAGRGVQAPSALGAPLVLEVGMRQYRADNQTGGSAGNSAASGQFESYVWTTTDLCGMSASSSEPTTRPGVGWHVTGEIVTPASAGAEQLTVNVKWQRVWDKGARVQNVASGSRSITLRSGERIELDRVLPAGASPCGATDARLEASVTAQPAYRLSVNRFQFPTARGGRGYSPGTTSVTGSTDVTAASAGAAAGGGGRGAGRGAGRGVGAGTGNGTGAATTTVDPATGAATVTGGGRGGRGAAANDTSLNAADRAALIAKARGNLRMMVVPTYDAELWLVHRTPDGKEIVQQQTVRFGGFGPPNGTFTFPPIQVQTSKGVIGIDISGRLQSSVGSEPGDGSVISQTTAEPAAAPHISVKIDRRAHLSGPPLLDITGGSSMVIDVPSPSDVLSFEFPALQKSAEDLLKGHQFSLRVRVTPSSR
jgi:hypothetical protein